MTRAIFLRCPRLLEAGFEHGFGTRHSRDREIPGLASVRQVHGTRIVQAPDELGADEPIEADAVWTAEPGLAVGVVTADCVPILLADRRGRAVAAVHAGWRGSVAGIAEVAVAELAGRAAASPRDLWAVIGPHIGPCCYEVDAPVIDAVAEPRALRPARRAGRQMLDLFELNRIQLVRAGLSADAILRVPACTSCDPRFDSYRRDGTGGRMRHYVRMPGGPPPAPGSAAVRPP